MVSRIEIALIIGILFFSTRGIVTAISSITPDQNATHKVLEMERAQLYEVNETTIQSIIITSQMLKYTDKTLFKDFRLYTPALTLISKSAVERNATIILDSNATVLKANGTRYHTAYARYNRHTTILELTGTFGIRDRQGEINGTTMQYNSRRQEIKGTAIRAKYEME